MKNLILTLCCVLSLNLSAESQEGFPYVYTPEQNIKSWQKVRVEGHDASYLKNPLRFLGYSIKAFKKKFTAPKEEIAYFKDQIKVFEALETERKSLETTPKEGSKEFKVSLVGDLMWLRTGWSGFLADDLRKDLSESDFLFGNLETLISKSHEVPSWPPARATFNSPTSLIDEFKAEGRPLFSALSVANNHSLDYGELGFKETLDVLQQRQIPFSGILHPEHKSTQKRWVSLEKNGLRVGFYAATYGMNNQWEKESSLNFNLISGLTPFKKEAEVDLSQIEKVLKEMQADNIDLKIISLHWGYEYEYYPEPKQMVVARDIVKLGADIIMGHHSHSQQPLEMCFVNDSIPVQLKGSSTKVCHLKTEGAPRRALIAYGLGNFLTNMYGFLSEVGAILNVSVVKGEEGVQIETPHIRLVYNDRDHGDSDQRQLLYLDDYLDQNCGRKKHCPKDDLRDVNFLKSLYFSVK